VAFVSRGFRDRRRPPDESGRVPPGQYVTDDFPVLSAGPTPHTPLAEWDLSIAAVETDAAYVTAFCDGGYTTNLPLEDVAEGKAWIAYAYDGAPLEPEHGGPARLLVPHLYFWKSAKWVRGLRLMSEDEPGFWETLGYHAYGDPWREQRYWGD
jgi:DMSO/TMAO reductase YedYZ molybdopterin-dependent catalytic subunit